VTSYPSAPDDLVLHAMRVLGVASLARIASHYDLDEDDVEDLLLDFGGRGWVSHASFGGRSGWYLTDDGRVEDERRMAAEVELAGVRAAVVDAHAAFLRLNQRFGRACTNWQIRPTVADPMAANDHSNWVWDERVLRSLESLGRELEPVTGALTASLARFDGYGGRYSAAIAKVNAGKRDWVDALEVDSCHTVWIQLHEDLLATLGIPRGSDDS
jgi:hypothetical protein